MAKELTKAGSNAVAQTTANPWAEAARGVESGTYLKFNGNDGRWSFGQDDDDLPEGSRVVVDMETFALGMICWVDGSVEEEKLVPVIEGKPPREEELTDYGPYDDDDDGWREAASLSMVLESYGDDDQDEAVGTPFLWKTSTGGQVRQMRKLSGAYGRVFAQHPDEFPIVELSEESYAPRNKKHGKKKFSPILKIVGWMTAAELEGLAGEPVDDEEQEEEAAPKKAVKSKAKAAPEPEVDEEEEEEAKPRRRTRKAAPEPEVDEDDEEEEKPRRRTRKAAPEPEDDEEEEEEVKPRRRTRKAAPEPEDDEEEEEEVKPRRRTRKAAPEPEDDEEEEEAAPTPRGRSAARGNRRMRNFD